MVLGSLAEPTKNHSPADGPDPEVALASSCVTLESLPSLSGLNVILGTVPMTVTGVTPASRPKQQPTDLFQETQVGRQPWDIRGFQKDPYTLRRDHWTCDLE